jgi:hypothetical protein
MLPAGLWSMCRNYHNKQVKLEEKHRVRKTSEHALAVGTQAVVMV